MPGGRISFLNEESEATILECLSAGTTLKTAYQAAGISERVFMKWMQKGRAGQEPYVQFVQKVKTAQGKCKRSLVGIIRKASKKTWTAAAWLLERVNDDEYGSNHRELKELRREVKELADRVGRDSKTCKDGKEAAPSDDDLSADSDTKRKGGRTPKEE